MCKIFCCSKSSFFSRKSGRQSNLRQDELFYFQAYTSPPTEIQVATLSHSPSDTDSMVTIPLSDNEKASPRIKESIKKTTWKPDFFDKPYHWL